MIRVLEIEVLVIVVIDVRFIRTITILQVYEIVRILKIIDVWQVLFLLSLECERLLRAQILLRRDRGHHGGWNYWIPLHLDLVYWGPGHVRLDVGVWFKLQWLSQSFGWLLLFKNLEGYKFVHLLVELILPLIEISLLHGHIMVVVAGPFDRLDRRRPPMMVHTQRLIRLLIKILPKTRTQLHVLSAARCVILLISCLSKQVLWRNVVIDQLNAL